jgi:hypothetical protein
VNPRTHGADRHICGIGDFVVGKTYNIAKDDGLSEVIRELEQRSLYVIGESDRCKDLIRRWRSPQGDVVAFRQRRGRATLLLSDTVEERITGDSPQPTLERPRGIGGKAFADLEEHFLYEVGRVIWIARETVRERVDLAPVSVRNIFPGKRWILGHGPHLVRYNAANAMRVPQIWLGSGVFSVG